MLTIYEQVENEIQKLEQEIDFLREEIISYPEGELFCNRDRQYTKWYIKNDHERKRLNKTNREFAEQMAVKKYLSTKYNDLLQERDAIQAYLGAHHSEKSPELLKKDSCYHELLQPYFQTVPDKVSAWAQESYRTNPNYPEQLIYRNINGHRLRSKSELFIDNALYLHHLAYRYECELVLGDEVFYPDFTICHPRTGKIYYYEHFGKMDDAEYIRKTCNKLRIYANNGIVPTINLITTYETREHPLTPDVVEKVICEYFL